MDLITAFMGISMSKGFKWELRWDWMFLFIIAACVIAIIATIKVRKGFNRYARYFTSRGLTGSRIAEQILLKHDAENVKVFHINGINKDEYDVVKKEINLSDNIYSSASVSAACASAYQCAHAIQDKENYKAKATRDNFIPFIDFLQLISWPLLLVGLVMGMNFYGGWLLKGGCILFALGVIFHLVTTGVEKDAARRAYEYLEDQAIVEGDELKAAKEVTDALSYTYVANSCLLLVQLFKILFVGWRRRRKEQEQDAADRDSRKRR